MPVPSCVFPTVGTRNAACIQIDPGDELAAAGYIAGTREIAGRQMPPESTDRIPPKIVLHLTIQKAARISGFTRTALL